MANRRTLEETRTLLLDTGTTMITEAGVHITLGQINLMDVSRAAGLKTAGSAYKIWDTQDEFRTDLLRHLVESVEADESLLAQVAEVIRSSDDLPPFSELIRSFAEQAMEPAGDGRLFGIYLTLLSASQNDEVVAARLAESDRALYEGYAHIYAAVVERYDREFVPPFDALSLAVSFGAIAEGFTLAKQITPELLATDLKRPTGQDGAIQSWHLFACAIEAIAEAFTRPRTPAD